MASRRRKLFDSLECEDVLTHLQTNVSLSQWSAYRSALNFSRPNEFIPERWLQTERSSRFSSDKKNALQAFSFGPRNCIGKSLAYAELRLILSRLLWNFDLSLPVESKGYDWANQKTYVLVEKQPLKVCLKLRHRGGGSVAI